MQRWGLGHGIKLWLRLPDSKVRFLLVIIDQVLNLNARSLFPNTRSL